MIPRLNLHTLEVLQLTSIVLGFAIVVLLGIITYRHYKGIK